MLLRISVISVLLGIALGCALAGFTLPGWYLDYSLALAIVGLSGQTVQGAIDMVREIKGGRPPPDVNGYPLSHEGTSKE